MKQKTIMNNRNTARINGHRHAFASKRSKALGEAIRQKRIELNKTAREVSAEAKITMNYIRYLEGGEVLNVYFLLKYLKFLGIDLTQIVAEAHDNRNRHGDPTAAPQ
jgi:cytoskeletal protein RodZ